jgi:hypothetical protein
MINFKHLLMPKTLNGYYCDYALRYPDLTLQAVCPWGHFISSITFTPQFPLHKMGIITILHQVDM